MRSRTKFAAMVVFSAAFALLFSSATLYAQNPPGPKGGPGAGKKGNPPGPRGGPGAGSRFQEGNPLGPKGGPGAGEEFSEGEYLEGGEGGGEYGQPPGRRARRNKAAVDRPWEEMADTNNDGYVDQTEINQWNNRKRDRDNNPPGPQGGEGTNWENPPGPKGGPGAGPEFKKGNPPGPRGGPGAGKKGNPPGPRGGPGAGPAKRGGG